MIRRLPAALSAWLCGGTLALFALALVLRLSVSADDLGPGGVGSPFFYVGLPGFVGFPVVGALIARRHPANPYGWLWCGLGGALAVLGVATALRQSTDLPDPLLAALADNSFRAALALAVFVTLLFPTGRLPSRRWRWLPRLTVALVLLTALLGLVAPAVGDASASWPWALREAAGSLSAELVRLGTIGILVCLLAATASLVVRFCSVGRVERQQLKWFLSAAIVYALTAVLDLVPDLEMGDGIWPYLNTLAAALFPLAVGVAVLRYRLFEIDRIVSRTVSYALLTAALLALYVVAVTVLRRVLDPVTGTTDLAVAASTLAVASAFAPARRRVQAAVDRRFDRARYDAARTVESFTTRLRTEVDLEGVVTGLRDTVVATVGPSRVAVWLRNAPPTREA